MVGITTSALSNFPPTFTTLGLLAAGVQILKTPAPRPPGSSAEAVLRWFLFFGLGVSLFYNFICHVFLGEMAARLLAEFSGW
jgi:hypothetical protein